MPSQRFSSFEQLDSVLRPVAVSSVGSPQALLLALLVRGAAAGSTPTAIRAWTSRRLTERTDLQSLLADQKLFNRLAVSAFARSSAFSSSPAAGRLSLSAARRLVGSLLTPLDPAADPTISSRLLVTARHGFAVIAVDILTCLQVDPATSHTAGFDTGIWTHGSLAQALGITRAPAAKALGIVVDLQWLTLVSKAPTGARRYRLARLRPHQQTGVLDHFRLVGELAASPRKEGQSRAAAVIRSAGNPAWNYSSEAGAKTAFLTALADAVGAAPESLGVPVRSLSKARKMLDRMGVADCLGDEVAGRLDAFATADGADARAAEAARIRRAEMDQRAADVAADAALRKAMAPTAKSLIAQIVKALGGRIPAADAPEGERAQWVRKAGRLGAQALAQRPASAAQVAVLRAAFRGALLRANWTPAPARAAALMIMPTPKRAAA